MGKAARAAQRRSDVSGQLAQVFKQAGVERPVPRAAQAEPPAKRVEVEPGYPEDWRSRLSASADRMRRERERQEVIVAQAIAAGATWSAIGRQLGTTRQGAWKRFRHLDPKVRVDQS